MNFAATCSAGAGGDLLGIPTWYKYLDCDGAGNVQNFEISQIWLIVAAVFEMLLRLGALVAVVFVIIGGFMMLTSSGNPERVASGRTTIINALIGLVITVMAAALVSVVGSNLSMNTEPLMNVATIGIGGFA